MVLKILSTHCIAYYRPHTSYIVLRILSSHCITYHRLRIPYMVLRILSPHSTLSPLLSHPHRAASGGGAPCLTAGDTRAERGGTRGKITALISDAGGVALKASRKYHPSLHQEKNSFLLSRCHRDIQRSDKQRLIGVTTR